MPVSSFKKLIRRLVSVSRETMLAGTAWRKLETGATLDLQEANRANAKKSLERGPLRDWWQEGLGRVRMIE